MSSNCIVAKVGGKRGLCPHLGPRPLTIWMTSIVTGLLCFDFRAYNRHMAQSMPLENELKFAFRRAQESLSCYEHFGSKQSYSAMRWHRLSDL